MQYNQMRKLKVQEASIEFAKYFENLAHLQTDRCQYAQLVNREVKVCIISQYDNIDVFLLKVYGGAVNGDYIGFLYDVLLSVCRRTSWRYFSIYQRYRDTIKVDMYYGIDGEEFINL